MINGRRVGVIVVVSVVAIIITLAIQVLSVNYYLGSSAKEVMREAVISNPDITLEALGELADKHLEKEYVKRSAVMYSLFYTSIVWFVLTVILRLTKISEAMILVPAIISVSYPLYYTVSVYFLAVAIGMYVNIKRAH